MPPALATSIVSNRQRALFETTKRVLASAVNDGLARATIEESASVSLSLCLRNQATTNYGDTWIKCGIRADSYVETDGGKVIGFIRADDLLAPVLIRCIEGGVSEELDPGVICRIICLWGPQQYSSGAVESLMKEVQNSADNQGKWLEIATTLPTLHLKSSLTDWERSVVFGHPTHPLHRTCLAQSPLKAVMPDDIPELLRPELSFLSVTRSQMKAFGPFEKLLEPLLKSLRVAKPESPDLIVVPCFSRQLPNIMPLFPDARQLRAVQNCCQALVSIRTLSFAPEVDFPFHLKLSLNCQITSGPRTITPWSAALGPVLSKALEGLLPPNLWVFEEVASITGGQDDFAKARHLTCIIRQSLEQQAENLGQALIPVTGLYQKPLQDDRTYMEIMFGLDDLPKRQTWFRRYLAQLFSLFLPPLARYGIGFESHSQNTLVRIDIKAKEVVGFAVRDFGGIRVHHPTFRRSGRDLGAIPAGASTITDDLHAVWHKVHHALLQVHVGHLLYMLGLESNGGWPIVREELRKALNPSADPGGRMVYDFFMQVTMPFKCFMEMRLQGLYRDYYQRELPNILLRSA
ncbi:IucC family-domain-containing protein [Aspergillus alliaceus]|uniref:IucC family-domain-containing protein n=1 Tax=Petromyces alliaceus TaxID=209559 RepID=UPI0012A4CFCD|nr:IucC family-domain-containing protein [Aspergillus alliaceus]KAB8229007.1 IucC family-domain-containing protein [Aspergillus alliaceus]